MSPVKKGYKHLGDKPEKFKVKSNAKFNLKYIDEAARMVAAGMDEKDLAFLWGISPLTIPSWKKRYPQFKKACEVGKEVAKQHAIAQLYRAAVGYDYDKTIKVYKADGKTVTSVKVITEHQKGEPLLMQFLLSNLDPENWKQRRKYEITEKRFNFIGGIDGKLDFNKIAQYAGRLLPDNSEGGSAKPVISTEVSSSVSEGQRVSQAVPSDVSGEVSDSVQHVAVDA